MSGGFGGGATLAAARVVLGVDSAQFSEGLRAAEAEYATTVSSMGGLTAELAERQYRTAAATTRLTETLQRYSRDSAVAQEATAGLIREQRKLVDTQAMSAAESAKFGRLSLQNSTHVGGFSRALGLATNAFLGGAGLVYGLKIAVTAATKFQSEMKLLQTQALTSSTEVQKMTKAVKEMAGPTATAPQELAKGIYRVESAGYRGAKAVGILRTAAMGAKIGMADLESTTTALVSAQKSGIRGAQNLGQAMGTLDAIVGAGNMRMQDLTSALASGVVPAAKQFGLSLQQLGGALDVLTVQGVPAELAATRLRYTIALLGAQTPKASKELQQIGLTSTEVGRTMRTQGLLPALDLLKEKLDASGLSIESQNQILVRAFGGGRSSTTILTLIQNLDMLHQKTALIEKEGTQSAFHGRWLAYLTTAQAQFARLRAEADVLLIGIGNAVMPDVVRAAKGAADWIQKGTNMKRVTGDVKEGLHDAGVAAHVFGNALEHLGQIFHMLGGSSFLKIMAEGFLLYKAANFAKSLNKNFINPMSNLVRVTNDAQKELDSLHAKAIQALPAEQKALYLMNQGGYASAYGRQPISNDGQPLVKGGSPVADEIMAKATSAYPNQPWMRYQMIKQLELQKKMADDAAKQQAQADKIASDERKARTKDNNERAAELRSEKNLAKAEGRTFNTSGIPVAIPVAGPAGAEIAAKVKQSMAADEPLIKAKQAETEASVQETAASEDAATALEVLTKAATLAAEALATRGIPTGAVPANRMPTRLTGTPYGPMTAAEAASALSAGSQTWGSGRVKFATPVSPGSVEKSLMSQADMLQKSIAEKEGELSRLDTKIANAKLERTKQGHRNTQATLRDDIAMQRAQLRSTEVQLKNSRSAAARTLRASTVPGGPAGISGALSGGIAPQRPKGRVIYIGDGKWNTRPFPGAVPHMLTPEGWQAVSEEEAATIKGATAGPKTTRAPRELYSPGPFYYGGQSEALARENSGRLGKQGFRYETVSTSEVGTRTIKRGSATGGYVVDQPVTRTTRKVVTLSAGTREELEAEAKKQAKDAADARRAADKAAREEERRQSKVSARQAQLDEEARLQTERAQEARATGTQNIQRRKALMEELAGLPSGSGGLRATPASKLRKQITDLETKRDEAFAATGNREIEKAFNDKIAALKKKVAALPPTPARGGAVPIGQQLDELRSQRKAAAQVYKNPSLDPAYEAKRKAIAEQMNKIDKDVATTREKGALSPAAMTAYEKEAAKETKALKAQLKERADAVKAEAKTEMDTLDSQIATREDQLKKYGPGATSSSPAVRDSAISRRRKEIKEELKGLKEEGAGLAQNIKESDKAASSAQSSASTFRAAEEKKAAESQRVVSALAAEADQAKTNAKATQGLVDEDTQARRAAFERASATQRLQTALEKLTMAQAQINDLQEKGTKVAAQLVDKQDEQAMLTKQAAAADDLYARSLLENEQAILAETGKLVVEQELASKGFASLAEEEAALGEKTVQLTDGTRSYTAALSENSAAIENNNRLSERRTGTTQTSPAFYGPVTRRDMGKGFLGSSGEPMFLRRTAMRREAEISARAIMNSIRGGIGSFASSLRSRLGEQNTQMAAGMMLTMFGPQIAGMVPGGNRAAPVLTGAGSGMLFGSMISKEWGFRGAGVGASIGLGQAVGHGKWGSTLGMMGAGAMLGTAIPGVGTGVGAAVGAAAGLGLALTSLIHSVDSTSTSLQGLDTKIRSAQSNAAMGHQRIVEGRVALANDKVSLDQYKSARNAAKAAYEHAKGTKAETTALDAYNAAEQNYLQAQRQVRQDQKQINAGQAQHTKGLKAEQGGTKALANQVGDLVQGYKNSIQGGRSMATAMHTAAGRAKEAEMRVQAFVGRLNDLGHKAESSHPHLAKVYFDLARIYKGMKNLPSSKVIKVIFEAIYKGDWKTGMSAAGAQASRRGAHGPLTGHFPGGRNDPNKGKHDRGPTKPPRQPYVDPAGSAYIAHIESEIAQIQAGLIKGNVRKLEEEELKWLRSDYRRARTDAQKASIADAISQLKSQMTSQSKKAATHGGAGLIPQKLQDAYNKAYQKGDKQAELRALEAERRYLERLAAHSHGATHHKAEELLNQIVGRIDRLIGVTKSSLAPVKDQLAVERAIRNQLRGHGGNVAQLEQKRDFLLKFLAEPGHSRKDRQEAERELKKVQRAIRQAKAGGGGYEAIILALQKEAKDLDKIANNPKKSLKTREKALAEENRVLAEIKAYEKKAFGTSGADFLTTPAQMKQWLKLQNAYAKAQQTPGTTDDIKALEAEKAYLQRIRDHLHGKALLEANKLLAKIDSKLQKLIDVSSQTQKDLMQTYQSELASFFAAFGSNVFTGQPGQYTPGSGGVGGTGGAGGAGGGGTGDPPPAHPGGPPGPPVANAPRAAGRDGGVTLVNNQYFPPGTQDAHDRHAAYARAALQSAFD